MISPKLPYFNNYRFLIKLVSLLLTAIFLVSCNKNETNAVLHSETLPPRAENAVNINTATVEELQKLPHIGEKLARKIVEHRERYGGFRRPAQLLLVNGISDERFRAIESLVKTE